MAIEAPQEDPVFISEGHLRSRGPTWPAPKRRERETKAKRMRPAVLNEQTTPLIRGPSGLPRSGKSGKTEAPLLSRRPVTDRCALSGEYPARAET